MSQPKIDGAQLDLSSLTFDGAAGWDDMIGNLTAGNTSNANDPTWAAFRGGVYAWRFSATALNEIWISFHINHEYAPGTVIYPHIHWSTDGTNTGTVRWGIEYTVAKGYDRDTFPAPTTIYLEQAATGTAYRHMIAEAALVDAIPTTHLETDSIILMRVFRDGAHANDTCTDPAFGLFCDLHFQKQAFSTPNKNYPFS